MEPGQNLFPGPYGIGKSSLELYDLKNDIGERKDLAPKYPNIVQELQELGEKITIEFIIEKSCGGVRLSNHRVL